MDKETREIISTTVKDVSKSFSGLIGEMGQSISKNFADGFLDMKKEISGLKEEVLKLGYEKVDKETCEELHNKSGSCIQDKANKTDVNADIKSLNERIDDMQTKYASKTAERIVYGAFGLIGSIVFGGMIYAGILYVASIVK